MSRGFGCALLAVVATGCLWEHSAQVDRRLARLQAGVNTRRVAMPTDSHGSASSGTIARVTNPTAPAEASAYSQGVTGNLQFTMRQTRNLYAGAEIEFGPFSQPGSYFSGAYGVVGTESRWSAGSISLELTGGRQWLREGLGAENVGVTMLEPRARGQLLLSEQISVGGVIGASVLGDKGWLAGVYIGLYSKAFQ